MSPRPLSKTITIGRTGQMRSCGNSPGTSQLETGKYRKTADAGMLNLLGYI